MPNELMKTLTVGANTYDLPQKTSDLTNDSGFITNETDPTVPSWAKASSKPTYTASEVGAATSSHTHGNITNGGDITTNATIASGDRIIINDESASKITNSSVTFGSSTTQYLANNGTWQNIPTVPTKTSDLTNDSGFITSESDPVFSASAAAGISSSDITNWDGKADSSDLSSYLPLAGGTLTGNLTIGASTDTTNRGVYLRNSANYVSFNANNSSGAVGVYDNSANKWLIYADSNRALFANHTPASGDNSKKIATTEWVQTEITDSLGDYLPLSGGTMTGMVDFGTAAAPISSTVLMQGYVVGGSSASERTYKDLTQLVNADGNRVAVVRAIDDVGYNELDLMVFSENNNPTNAATFTNTNGTKTARIYGDLTILSPSAGDNSTHAASTAWAQNEFKYKSGDVVNVGGGVFAGYFDSSKNLYFHIPLNKDLARISSASISTDTSWAIFCAGSVLLSNTTLASFGTITCTKTDIGVLVKVVPSSTASITARQTVSVRANGAYITLT